MKKLNSYILLFLFAIITFIGCGNIVNAKDYGISFEAYRLTSQDVCDPDPDVDGVQGCFEIAMEGELDSYLIDGDSYVVKDDKIMVLIKIDVPEDVSDLQAFAFELKTDPLQATFEEENYALNEGVGGPTYSINPWSIFPPNGTSNTAKKKTSWSISTNAVDTSDIVFMAESGDYQMPLVKSGYLGGLIYTIGDVPAGKKINFTIDTKGSTNASGSMNGDNPTILTDSFDWGTLTLQTLSTVSTNYTLSKFDINASNGTATNNYPFGFVASSDTNMEYNLIVPNAVTTLNLDMQTSDSNAKGISGITVNGTNQSYTIGNSVVMNANGLKVGDNTLNVSVTSEEGTVGVYKIKVRRLSSDATLESVTATNGVVLGPITSGTTTYSTTVPYKTATTDVSAVPTANASGAEIASGTGTWNLNTDNNTNTLTTKTIVVNAEDYYYSTADVPGNVQHSQTYTFKVTRTAPSKNVKLSTITIDGSQITGFNKTTYSYNLGNVSNATSSINLGAIVDDNLNQINSLNVNGSNVSITKGTSLTKSVNLNVGDNTIIINILSEDGTTNKDYTLNIHRLSNESLLQTLSVTSSPQGSMSPSFTSTFDSKLGEYTYTYDPNVTSINFAATVKDTGKAKVRIVDANNASNTKNTTDTLNSSSTSFGIETTKVNVIVTAEDNTTRTYVINLARQKSTNNYLKSLSINPGTINETFSPTKGTYTATVAADVTSTTVNAILADTNATLTSITGNTDFKFGNDNQIVVTVTSESGSVNNYTIKVNREKYAIATLDSIKYAYGDATLAAITGFNKNTLEYTLSTSTSPVSFETTSINLDYELTNEYATVTGDTGVKQLKTGDNQFRINVTSQDGKVTNTYKINVYRAKNTDNDTKGLTVAGVGASLVSESDPYTYEVTLPNSQATLAPSEVIVSASDDAKVTKPSTTMSLSTKNVNVYTYSVTSESGIVQNYQVNITRTKSANADASRINLYLDGEKTSSRYCVLAKTETSCTIEVPTGTTGYTLEAIIDAEATVTPGNDTKYTMTTAASDSSQTRIIKVTAEDLTEKSYTVIVNRAKSSNANLSSIKITDVTNGANTDVPVNNFGVDKVSYNITVPALTEDIKIDATTEDEKAEILTDLTLPKTLSFDSVNQITIQVRAENGTTTKAYVLNITRSRGIDATLKDIKVEGTTISGFTPESTSYIYTNVPYNKTTLSLQGITNDENANITGISVNGKAETVTQANDLSKTVNLSTGTNVIDITVTAHNTSITKVYKVTVDRALNNNTNINGINVINGGSKIAATVDGTDSSKYYVTVPNSITEANSTNIELDIPAGETSYDAKATYSIPTVTLDTLNPDNTPVDNQVVIPVIAEDGTLKNYTLVITRTPSAVHEMIRTNAYTNGSSTISSFCLYEGKLNCTINVTVDTTSFKLEGILTDPKSSVTFTDGTTTGDTFTMSSTESTKTITATVLAENGVNKSDYTIRVVRAKSSNNYLSDLQTNANDTVLSTIGSYVKTDNTYTLTVPGTQSSIDFKAIAEDSKSVITSTDYSGTPGNTIAFTKNLAYGANVVKIKVTAENSNENTYTITVNRSKNIDPTLSDLKVNTTTVDSFDKDTKTYNLAQINYSTTKIALNAITTDTLAKVDSITVNGNNVKITKGNNVNVDIPLSTGTNTIVVNTTAHDETVLDSYTINISRKLNSNTGIQGISIKNGSIDINATKDPTDDKRYLVTVPNSITEANQTNVEVTVDNGAVATDALATYIVNTTQLDTLDTGGNAINNNVNILITAEDGTTDTYTLVITRTPSAVHEMTRVNLYTGIETETSKYCVFDKGKVTCTINVDVDTTQFTLEGILTDPKSKVEFSSGTTTGATYTMPTKESTKEVKAMVVAENGVDYTEYTITVVRAKSSNNYLKTITTNGDSETMVEINDFANTKTNYEVIVPGTQSTIDIHAEAEDDKSTISTAGYTGTETNTIDFTSNLAYGDNTIEVIVKAENNDTRTYTIKVTRQKNIEPRLSMIYINGNPIDNYLDGVTFDPDVNEYTLNNFSYNTELINITATNVDSVYGTQANTGNHDLQTIYYGTDYTTSTEYVNNIEIRGVAHDTTIYKKYTLHIKRNANNNTKVDKVEMNYNGSRHVATYNVGEEVYEITVPNSVKVADSSNVIVTTADPRVPSRDAYATSTMDSTTLVTNDPTDGNVNTHKFTVIAEDGTTKEYTMKITREKSNVALLTEILVKDPDSDSVIGSFQPSFKEGTYVYTVNVPVTTDKFVVEATAKEDNATIRGNEEYDMNSSTMKIEVVVTSEDQSVAHTYTLNIVREANNDNSLATLTVEDLEGNGYTVIPDDTDSTKFKVEVPGAISELQFNATANSPLATVSYVGVKAGTTNIYTIPVGTNTYEFKIRSESGATQSYYVDVTRKPKNDASLKSITYTLGNGSATLMEGFESTKHDYDLGTVPYGTSYIYISAVTNDPDATIKGESAIGQQTIATGPNKYIITVEAQDGTTTEEYTISIEREKNNDATLSVLSISGETFNETWDKDQFNYSMTVDETKAQIKQSQVTAIPSDRNAKVTIDADLTLSTEFTNYYKVTVTAENGETTNIYTIAITRPKSTDATLKAVNLTDATMSPKLTSGIYEYTIIVPYGKKEFTIEGVPNVESSVVYTNGVKNLDDGAFTLTVQAENGNTQVYKFNVSEAKSTDATLSTLSVNGYPFTGTHTTYVPTTTDYTIGDIESSVEKIVVNATPANADSTVKYYNDGDLVSECTNNESCEITLKTTLGEKTITVEVTAPDTVTKKQYFITYNKVKSNDAYLSSITATAGTFDKVFNKGTTTYELSLTYDVSAVDLTFITENKDASVKVNTDTANFSPVTYSITSIAEGETKTVQALVTAQDGITKETYTILVTRATYSGSNDAFLSSLSVDGYPFIGTNSTFKPTETDYTIGQIPYALAELTINATTNVSTSKLTYYVDGVQQTSNVVTIPREDATISVKVTAEDNITTKVYNIAYTKKANNNAYLSDIIVSGGTLDPAFSKSIYTYSIPVADDQDTLDLTFKTEDKNATIKVNGSNYISGNLYSLTSIPTGSTIVSVVVTAEDGKTSQTYKINLVKGDISEIITSVAFGHTIEDGYIKTVAGLATVQDVKNQLDNDNVKLQIWKSDDSAEKSDSDKVGTGDVVKLIINGNVADSKIIVIKGDLNGDGKHNALDVSGVINHYLKTNVITDGAKLLAADVNVDSKINALDVSAIINHYLNTNLIIFK